MTKFIFILALVLAVPAHAEKQTETVHVRATVSQYVDTDSPTTEPEALSEMQAVSTLEPAAGDDVTESDTVYVDAPIADSVTVEYDDLYTEVQSYE